MRTLFSHVLLWWVFCSSVFFANELTDITAKAEAGGDRGPSVNNNRLK